MAAATSLTPVKWIPQISQYNTGGRRSFPGTPWDCRWRRRLRKAGGNALDPSLVGQRIVHEPPPALEQVRPCVGGLDSPLGDVLHMTALSRSAVYALMAASRFPKPIRIGTRAVRHGRDPVVLKHLRQRRRRYRLPAPHREHEPAEALAQRARRVEHLHRPHSGTRCSRFAFIRVAAIVHTGPAVSTSSHVASRTSADRAAVSTRNSNASLTAGARTPTPAPSRRPRQRPGEAAPAGAPRCHSADRAPAGRFCSSTRPAASAKVGMPWTSLNIR